MSARRWAIGLGAGAVLLVAGYLAAPHLARRMSFFQIRRVEVTGMRYLRETDVVRALGLTAPRSAVDPLDSIRARAGRIPGVASASVERRFPGTLRVTILEERPVALAMHDGRLSLVDQRGRVLPFDPARQNASFPIADSGATAAGLLAQVLLADPLWYDEIESARLDGGDVVLTIGTHQIRLRPDADAETLDGVLAVREYLSEQGIAWREIDARYRGRVFVRKDLA